jgi:hypothetical protein
MLVLLMMISCAVLAYRYAETENLSGAFWAVVSLVLWFGVGLLLPVHFLVVIGVQFAMLVMMRCLAIRRNNC